MARDLKNPLAASLLDNTIKSKKSKDEKRESKQAKQMDKLKHKYQKQVMKKKIAEEKAKKRQYQSR